MINQEFANFHISRYHRLKSDRGTLDSHLQEVYDYCLPRKNQVNRITTPGEKQMQEIYDVTAIEAAERFAAGLYNYMWPAGKRNFILTPSETNYQDVEEFKRPLGRITEIIHSELAISNFANEIYECFADDGVSGTSNLYFVKGKQTVFNFSSRHISEYVFCENSEGFPDTCYRMHKWSARQAIQEFGATKVSQVIRDAVEKDGGKDADKEFEFLHVAAPNEEIDLNKQGSMAFVSVWIEAGEKKIVSVAGDRSNPYIISRFMKGNNEIYGRSPAMKMLPAIKLLNKIREDKIIAVGLQTLPPILSPDDGFVGPVNLTQAALIYYRARGDTSHRPEPMKFGDGLEYTIEEIQALQAETKTGFYNDLFLILQDEKARTATEVIEIVQEKLNILGPNFGRLKVERFDPLISRAIEILADIPGKLPSVPAEMEFYNIEYISTLALAVKYNEIRSASNLFAMLSPLNEIKPDIWDNYNLDTIAQGLGETMGTPVEWRRPQSEIRAIREARQQAEAAQNQMAIMAAAADRVPKLQKKSEQGSPMAKMEEQMAERSGVPVGAGATA